MSVNMLKQVGDKLDVVNVMSYGEIRGRSGQQAGCCRSAGLLRRIHTAVPAAGTAAAALSVSGAQAALPRIRLASV